MENSQPSIVEKIKRNLTSKQPGEHLLDIIKAGLASVPFCGAISSLMSDYIPSARQERLENFAQQIAEDLAELQNRVDENILLTDEFAFIFEKCFRGVADHYQAEKIEAFRGILLNSAIDADLNNEEKEYFLNLVNTLSVLHIRILRFMNEPISYLDSHGVNPEKVSGGFSEIFSTAIPGIDIEVIKSAFGELHQYGFISTDKSIFNTMTSSQGLALLGNRVTEMGKRFIDFCTKPH